MKATALKGPTPSIIAAAVMLSVSGMAYRIVRAQITGFEGTLSIPRGTLADLPMTIGLWEGRDVPLNEAVVRATDSDDHVNRSYTLAGSGTGAALFISYGVRFRDLMPHRPEVCYPGAGWTVDGHDVHLMTDRDGGTFSGQIHHFSRGGLAMQRMTVLNCYIVDGEVLADIAELRSAMRPRSQAIRYVVQVQIAAGGTSFQPWSDDLLRGFAAEAIPAIVEFLGKTVEQFERPGDSEPEVD